MIPKSALFRKTLRRIKNKFISHVPILLYHRVDTPETDPQLLCVTPEHFKQHLEILKSNFHPIRLSELARSLQKKELHPKAVVITFDDGYADNFYNAKPLLEHYHVPATIFIATDYLEGKHEFWWDDIEKLILYPGNLHPKINLNISGNIFTFDLGNFAHYTKEHFMRYKTWNVLWNTDPTPRHRLYKTLHHILRSMLDTEQQEILEQIRKHAETEVAVRSTHRILTADEVHQFSGGDVIDAGAHSLTHSVLSRMSLETQKEEITESKIKLEAIFKKSVTSFAYPYGSRSDYTRNTVTIVREAGFECACTTFSDVTRPGSNCFELPRIIIRNYDGETFYRSLQEWIQ